MPIWLITSRKMICVQCEKCITLHKQHRNNFTLFSSTLLSYLAEKQTVNHRIQNNKKKLSDSPFYCVPRLIVPSSNPAWTKPFFSFFSFTPFSSSNEYSLSVLIKKNLSPLFYVVFCIKKRKNHCSKSSDNPGRPTAIPGPLFNVGSHCAICLLLCCILY